MEHAPDAQDGLAAAAGCGLVEHVELAGAFLLAAIRYWLVVFPRTAVQLRRWRRRAARIPDPMLRDTALKALDKRGNIEGAAAFAAFVPWRWRGRAVRALVAFQVAYNHADMLAEQPSGEPAANARRLHEALLVALDPDAQHPDYYALDPQHDDAGYLAEIVDCCRTALGGLPSFAAVAAPARRAASRIVAFQSFSVSGQDQLERWAHTQLSPDGALEWWETAAAGGSSLGVHALIAAAAVRSLPAEELAAIEGAYFPWIGALHSLLDSLLDELEDAATGQLSLVGRYRCSRDAASRMRSLTVRALAAARTLPDGRSHQLLVAAMACHYLSALDGTAAGEPEPAWAVREALGALAGPALVVFRARRLAGRRRHGPVRVEPASPAIRVGDERGVDARAA